MNKSPENRTKKITQLIFCNLTVKHQGGGYTMVTEVLLGEPFGYPGEYSLGIG